MVGVRRGIRKAGILCVALLLAKTALAVPVTYYGIDVGVGPGGSRPNSDAAAASFDAALSAAYTQVVDFESASLGYFTSLTVAPGVTATMTGMANSSSCGITNVPGTSILGYNTTSGGARHLRAVPVFGIGTCIIDFDFDIPSMAWGAYITGLGTANGNLFLMYDDGSVQQHSVMGNTSGGVLFFGVIDPGKVFSEVSLELRNVTGSRDIYSIDDMRHTQGVIPEPATFALVGVGVAGALGLTRRRRKKSV